MRHTPATLALLCFLLLFGSPARSQDEPRAEVFGGFSFLSVDTNNLLIPSRQNAFGWEASVSVNATKHVALEGDVSGHYKTIGFFALNTFTAMAGPRLNFGPAFVHALVGVDDLTGGAFGLSASQNSIVLGLGGGIEIPVAPHWAIRGSADYALTRHNLTLIPTGFTQNNYRIAGGVVFRFGSREGGGGAGKAAPRGRATPAGEAAPRGRATQAGAEESVLLGITGYADQSGGVRIASVLDFSPASGAGIKPGDVIMAIDRRAVHSSRDIEAAIGTSQTGTVRVAYFQDGVLQKEVDVRIR